MNTFQKCRNTSDVVPLYLPQKLYLKPLAELSITVKLPDKLIGKTISNWDLMEKLKALIKPEEFSFLKVSKSTLEYIKFDSELDDRNRIDKVVVKLHNKFIKLKDFNELFSVKAFECKRDFPNQHAWDAFFRETSEMDERKPGERPDTVHIANLPIRWFNVKNSEDEDQPKPSEKIVKRIFEKFGRIRNVDVPICDPYRKQMKSYMSGLQTFSFDEKDFFEAYIQFKDYQGFVKAMDALRGMKLLHKDEDTFENYCVSIKVDFDRTKHMTEAAIRRRGIVRERLVNRQKQREAKEESEKKKEELLREEKARRRREREERRKARILEQLKTTEADEINLKIAREEKKLLRAQRKLEAIRLVEELFKRIEVKREDNLMPKEKNGNSVTELSKYKLSSEKELDNQRNKLHKTIESRVVLKAVLNKSTNKLKDAQSDSETSLSPEEEEEKSPRANGSNLYIPNNPFPYIGPIYPDVRTLQYYPYVSRNRRTNIRGQGSSRGFRNFRFRGRGTPNHLPYYPPNLQHQYYKYFNKFLRRSSRSRSRTRSRTRTRTRTRSRSYSRSPSRRRRRRSRSRSRSRDRRSRSRSRSRGNRTRSESRSRDRSRSPDSAGFVSPRSLRKAGRERSEWSRTPSPRK